MTGVSEEPIGLDGVSPEVLFQALHPDAAGPEPPVESGAERVITPRYCLLMTSMPTVSLVEMLELSPAEVPDAVDEVRDLLRARGRAQAAWSVVSSEAEKYEQLTSMGMTPYTDPPLEPRCACMVLVQAPPGAPSPGVMVREATELADFLAVGELAAAVFGFSGEDRDGFMKAMRVRYELHRKGQTPMSTYVALVDGQVVGEAQAEVTACGANLSGSSVLPSARGRGVYRALVAARWDEAVARGRPALTVQAGEMSRPILERLGFRTVATKLILRDRFT
ncbi:MAG: GNAT family N-acetyltransferase [Actinomycetes bacterium]